MMTTTVIDVKTESSAPTWDNFPAGLRVMVVDDDEICLKLVEKMLQKCNYEVTICNNATQALETLRRKTQDFDLVLSDVYMPDMDGFKLLETIGLELDLPVIMMSSNGETTTVLRGVTHGAVDFLIKPVRIEELRNLWQHVIRKRKDIVRDMDSDEQSQDKDDQAESSKKRKDIGGSKDGRDMMRDDDGNAAKKPRVVWSVEMHQQFVNAVNQLGIDKAVPKKILELMNVDGLTRENVASHLQKYRLYLKRVAGVSPGSSRIKAIGPSMTAMAALAHQHPGMPGVQPNPAMPLPQQPGQQPQPGAGPQQPQAQNHVQNPTPQNPNGPPSIPQGQLPNSNSADPLSNAFAAGLLAPPQGGNLPFTNPNLSAMSAAQAANIAQAANLMGAMNVMGLGGGLAGAMGLSRLSNINATAGPNAGANMAMQLGMGGMGNPQLNAIGMGLNPGIGLAMPNMQGMAGAMGMAQMGGLAHLGMVGMGGMNGNNLLQSNLAAAAAAASNQIRPPTPQLPNIDPSSLLSGAAAATAGPPGGPSPNSFNAPHSGPTQPAPAPSPPPPSSAAAIAQELAMMESTSFDFPATSAPTVSEPPPPLESAEFNSIFNDSFSAPATTSMLADLPKQEQVPMDDFLSFLLKDGNLPSEA